MFIAVIFLLKLNSSCLNSCKLIWVHKVTTGTKSFVSFTVKFVCLVPEEQEQVRLKLTLQSIKRISIVLQKLLQKVF